MLSWPGGRGIRAVATRVAVCVLLALGVDAPAYAEPAAIEACVEKLDDNEVGALLAVTKESARDQRLGASLWFSGWSAFNIVNVSIGAWKIATVDSRVARDAWTMTAIGAGVFVLGAAILPLPGLYASLRLSRLPEGSAEERRAKLRRSLLLLESAAAGEDRNSNLTAHLGGLGYGLFSLGFIYLHNLHAPARDLAITAGLQFLFTVVGAEATIWSTPRRARRDLARVRQDPCAPAVRTNPARALARSLAVVAGPGQVRLSFRF